MSIASSHRHHHRLQHRCRTQYRCHTQYRCRTQRRHRTQFRFRTQHRFCSTQHRSCTQRRCHTQHRCRHHRFSCDVATSLLLVPEPWFCVPIRYSFHRHIVIDCNYYWSTRLKGRLRQRLFTYIFFILLLPLYNRFVCGNYYSYFRRPAHNKSANMHYSHVVTCETETCLWLWMFKLKIGVQPCRLNKHFQYVYDRCRKNNDIMVGNQ